MASRYSDTREGWAERGYKVTKGETPAYHRSNGEDLFTWGQVVPLTTANYEEFKKENKQ